MLLGLINAEKAQKFLMDDIEEQREMEDYYYYPPANNRGETLDIVRLNSATKLASSTIVKLSIGTTIATIYLLVCLGLFAGVIKNRSNFIVPWMVFDVIVSLVINSVLVIVGSTLLYEKLNVSEWFYCKFYIFFSLSKNNIFFPFFFTSFRVILHYLHNCGFMHMDCCISIL